MNGPACSVVVPSHERARSLDRLLAALSVQTVGAGTLDVVVVLDGSTDGSAEIVERWGAQGGFGRLELLRQPRRGSAAARNAGAAAALAGILLFLDDDVEPRPDLVARHLERHSGHAAAVVLGDCPVVRRRKERLAQLTAWAFWEDFLHLRAQEGRRAQFRDLCAGNVSMPAPLFESVGGFDERFVGYGGEDYELGCRLLAAGATLLVEPRARAAHHHRASVAALLEHTRQEGAGDVLIARAHPHTAPGLRLARLPEPAVRRRLERAGRRPRAADRTAALSRRFLPLYEALRLRGRWMERFDRLRSYEYWRGVTEALGSWEAAVALAGSARPPHVTLDVTAGLPEDLTWLPVDGPVVLDLRAEGRDLGPVEVPGPMLGAVRPHVLRHVVAALAERDTVRGSAGAAL